MDSVKDNYNHHLIPKWISTGGGGGGGGATRSNGYGPAMTGPK